MRIHLCKIRFLSIVFMFFVFDSLSACPYKDKYVVHVVQFVFRNLCCRSVEVFPVFPGMICACFVILMSYVGLCKKMTRFECPRTLQLKLQIKELLSRYKRIFSPLQQFFYLSKNFSSQCFFEKDCLG